MVRTSRRSAQRAWTGALLTPALSLILGACSGGGEQPQGIDGVHTLDLTNYDPGQTPSSLFVANETLVLPLRPGAQSVALSRRDPGDLQIRYTRVGCWIASPDGVLAQGGDLPAQRTVRLLAMAIEQELRPGNSSTLHSLGEETCFTYRTADGHWQALIAPMNIVETAQRVRTEITLQGAQGDAIAIFLPTWTNVRQVSYTIQEAP